MAMYDDNAALVRRFYESFAKGDAAGMNACYAPDVVFSDPAFGELRGDRARAMWTMLCANMKDFSLTYEIREATDTTVVGRAVATYLYSATGNTVRNEIEGTFTIANGAIVHQDDRFDIWKWSAQALGAVGTFAGWTPMIKRKIRATALGRLESFIKRA